MCELSKAQNLVKDLPNQNEAKNEHHLKIVVPPQNLKVLVGYKIEVL